MKGARILVTRAQPGAAQTAVRIEALGGVSVVSPVLKVADVAAPRDALAGAQAVLLTSINAALRLGAFAIDPATPVIAVGDTTAQAARKAGAGAVMSAAGDVEAVAKLAAESLDASRGLVAHMRGVHVAGDLSGALNAAGFDVREVVVYEARRASKLTDEATDALRSGPLSAVLLHSARGAQSFAALVHEAGLEEQCGRLVAAALGRAALAEVESLGFVKKTVASQPTETALLDAARRALLSGSGSGA